MTKFIILYTRKSSKYYLLEAKARQCCTVSLNVALCPVVAALETPYTLKGPQDGRVLTEGGVVGNYQREPSRMNGVQHYHVTR